ncbi:glycosyltransferase [Mycobacterium sp. NPDC003323]
MRVLLYTFGSRGDIQPLVALALALQRHGADAVFCAPPDFGDLLAANDLTLVPTGPSVHELVHVRRATAADAPALAAELVATQFGTLDTARRCDAIVGTGLMPAGMRSVAELAGIPYRCAVFTPHVLPAPHHHPLPRPGKPFPAGLDDHEKLWQLDADKVQALYGVAVNAHRDEAGLDPVDNVRDHTFTEQPWLAVDPILSPWPPVADISPVQTGAWIVPDERPLPPALEDFLQAGPPPVYAGFGSVTAPENAAELVIEAIRDQGRRVVLGSGWAGLTSTADDCFVVGEINQQALFPRTAAVIHHGGAGTTTAAAAAGVPQIVVPQIVDQPYWASRVAALGIGVAHDGPTPTPASLAEALTLVLNPETQSRANALAHTIRTDGASTAAKMLLTA